MFDFKELDNGSFVRIWHVEEKVFTVGLFKGWNLGKDKLLIEETRILTSMGKNLPFKRVKWWSMKELRGNISRMNV